MGPELQELKEQNRSLKEAVEKVELDLRYQLKTKAGREEYIDNLKARVRTLEVI